MDIWDVIDPRFQDILSYRKSLSNDGSYEATHPELYTPDRRVYLDGTLQSTLKGNEPYHEALVHPGMFTHANPRRVAIIGGGEGATLREVLKHKSIQHVKMIDIDQGMVETSRDHLPMWNICSDIVGSTISCFDDARADVLCEDALAWFIHRFADDGNITSSSNSGSSNNNEKTLMKKEQKFDVIIMDAL